MESLRTLLVSMMFLLAGLAYADSASQTVVIANRTGHTVAVFLFTDGKVHTNEHGGVQIGTAADGANVNANVKSWPFTILLVDHLDIWQAVIRDRATTTFTFTKDTGHGRKQ